MGLFQQPAELLDRVRQAYRLWDYSRRPEKAYVGWIKRYIFFNGVRHPAEMGEAEVTRFLCPWPSMARWPPRPRTRL
jgi:hypothetical protein